MVNADFDGLVLPEAKKAKHAKDKNGELRSFLKVWETLPAQLLNCYGEAEYVNNTDEAVWNAFSEPTKTGAMWMTELCSAEPERRGVGINRFLLSMVKYCKYQQTEKAKVQNKAIMKPEVCDNFYKEIDDMIPAFTYCLAEKKEKAPTGCSALRGKASQPEGIQAAPREEPGLKANTKKVYDWLRKDVRSYIRMVMQWQACGGLSFVASTHHRGAQCFKYVGNALHGTSSKDVSLEEFQLAVADRHHGKKHVSMKETAKNADFEE
jgi:hypothetical protein